MNITKIIKMVLLGEPSVGKTSIIQNYISETFTNNYQPNVGGVYSTKNIELSGTQITLKLWDTAGQEVYRSLTKNYYRAADIIILVFDITKNETFHKIKDWIEEVKINCSVNPILHICGNKSDLDNFREIQFDQGKYSFCK
jgi:small GTP-binding protein